MTDQLPETDTSGTMSENPAAPNQRWALSHYLSLAVVSVYAYAMMEWLFYVTKPSFMDLLQWHEKLQILFVSPLPWVLVALLATIIGLSIGALLPRSWKSAGYANLGVLGGAAILTILAILIIDNFTWTLFNYGIASTKNYQTVIFLGLILLGFITIMLWLSRMAHAGRNRRIIVWIATGCLFIAAFFVFNAITQGSSYGEQVSNEAHIELPNILFFAADGINADHLAVYGSERQLTPYLDTLLEESLVMASAFSNASRTTGATTAMLTGRYPTTTKVLFPPHALVGEISFRHLPAILRSLGYRQNQQSVRYYADSFDLNMRLAFDSANNRVINDPFIYMPSSLAMGLGSDIHFAEILWQRVQVRALHLAGVKPMSRVYEAVTESAAVYGVSDTDRSDRAIEFMLESDKPFFAHVHLMGPHCCEFKPKIRKFSAGHQKKVRGNEKDYYYDTVLDSDHELERIVEALKAAGKWDNTILVYSSDHNMFWEVNKRVPLIMHFPDSGHTGMVKENSSLLDIAPTILDYLGIGQPAFMEGRSLIGDGLDPMEPLFSVGGMNREHFDSKTDRLSRLVGDGPPLYGLANMEMIICQRWYSLNTGDGTVKQGSVDHHPYPCDGPFPDDESARQMISAHLTRRGFTLSGNLND